jgi:CelD/BcsL family acetyltransferase involved in cellulose biosynthesis
MNGRLTTALPGPAWDALFDAGPDPQTTRDWFEATARAALPDGTELRSLELTDGGRPAALLPLRWDAGRLGALTSPYTTIYQPLLAPGVAPEAAGRGFGRVLRRHAPATLDALDPSWPGWPGLLAGVRRAGVVPLRWDQFGNWHERLDGLDWSGYLAGRPGALRETIRRRTRAAERDPAIRIDLIRAADDVPAALAAYEAIYARSWKEPEPFPAFNATLLPRLARLGVLRMGVLRRGDTPLAAQYWTLAHGKATVLKLAHDEAERALSPGTVLTAWMIRTLMDEGARELDFGRGDDPYKQHWAKHRRQRFGLVLATPWHPAGAAAIARHLAGRMRRRLGAWRARPV